MANAVEQVVNFSISGRAAYNCENALADFSRDVCNAGRCFSLERLPIQTPLARYHNIGIFYFRFKLDRFCDYVETRPNFRSAKGHQAESESASRARAGFVAEHRHFACAASGLTLR